MMKQFATRVLGVCSLMPVLILLGCAATPLQAANPGLPNIGTGLTAPLILQPKLLDAAVAFKFAARLKDSKTIEVRFQIAPGYYMYKDQFQASVQVTSQLNLTALAPILPVGNIVDDPGFGKVETYRQVVFFDVPLSEPVAALAALGGNAEVQFSLRTQGCADVGVCYPPQRHKLTLTAVGDFVPAASPSTTKTIGG